MFEFLEKHKMKLVYWPLVLYWLILLTATSLPGKDLPNLGVSDKIEHFTAYFILAVLLNISLLIQNKFKLLKAKASQAVLLIIAVYAALDELHQLFIPGRSCDILDWTADMAAAIAGVLIVIILVKGFRFKTAKP